MKPPESQVSHAPPGFTPQKKRRLALLSDEVGRVLDNDRRFLARRPDCAHSIRTTVKSELRVGQLLGVLDRRLPAGVAYDTLVGQIRPGIRFRKFTLGRVANDFDLNELGCRAIFERTVSGSVEDLERRGER